MIERENELMCIFFPQLVKKNAYFFPNWLKIYKIAQKKAENLYIIILNFIWAKNINKKGGVAKIWISNLIYTRGRI